MIGIKSLKQPKELAKFVPEHDIIKLSFEENDDFVLKVGVDYPNNNNLSYENKTEEEQFYIYK